MRQKLNCMENNSQYIFGVRPVIEAVKAGRKIDKVMIRKGQENSATAELLKLLMDAQISYQWVPVEKLDRTVRGAHQGVIAVMSTIDYVELEELVSKALSFSENPLIVILDGVTDVRNLGAIARSLECAGGAGIVVQATGGAAINAEAVKASAGALLRIDTCKVSNLKMAAYYLRQSGFRLIAATEKSDKNMYDINMTGPCAFIVGSEGHGISPAMLKISDDCARIPMSGEIASLNVSVATSVVLYEAVRQRVMSRSE